jgi:hypothetical protein
MHETAGAWRSAKQAAQMKRFDERIIPVTEPKRDQLVQQANLTRCGHVGFLWRLKEGGDGWHCYHCERMPDVPSPVHDIDLINAGRMPLELLRMKLGAEPIH